MKQANKNTKILPAMRLREELRQQAVNLTEQLGRSVSRMTSYDELACPEYADVVNEQYELINKLLYIQNCRKTLESGLVSGFARLKFKKSDNSVTITWFKRISMGRVVAGGLEI